MTVTLEYTDRGIEVQGTVVSADDMADWFETYGMEEDYFPSSHEDCVTFWDHELALKNQREILKQNLPETVRNYHDDERHTGAVQWCTNPVCEVESAKEIFNDEVHGW